MERESFRAGAGAVILDRKGRVLAFERADVPEPSWQLPQGGLEHGEDPAVAVLREVREETGLEAAELEPLGSLPEPLAYELPQAMRSRKTGRGQVLYWFFFRLSEGVEPRDPPEGEFRACRPMRFEELVEATAPFRRPTYQRLREHLEREIRPGLGALAGLG